MEAYTGFAAVYDTFMDNVPYHDWANYLQDLLREYDIWDGLILDLGCGTGSMAEELAKREAEISSKAIYVIGRNAG